MLLQLFRPLETFLTVVTVKLGLNSNTQLPGENSVRTEQSLHCSYSLLQPLLLVLLLPDNLQSDIGRLVDVEQIVELAMDPGRDGDEDDEDKDDEDDKDEDDKDEGYEANNKAPGDDVHARGQLHT